MTTHRHGDEEDMGHLLGKPESNETLATSSSDAGPAATPRAEEDPTPLEQAIERTSRHQDTPSKPRRAMSVTEEYRAARIAYAAWREYSALLGNLPEFTWDELQPHNKQLCEDLIEEMAGKPFGAATSRQAEIFQAIAYTVGE